MRKIRDIIPLMVFGALTLIAVTTFASNKESIIPEPSVSQTSDQSKLKSSDIDKPRGQLLYETHCGACHNSSVHSRKPHKADSIGKIKYWVTRWSTELNLNWPESDIDAVAQYLNSKYYKFKE